MTTKSTPHEWQLVGVFIPFGRGGLKLRLIAVVISIQPFVYVIGDYTCHDTVFFFIFFFCNLQL